MTGVYTYTTRKTQPKYRAIRFAILELFFSFSIPLSTTIGGSVLAMKPWFPSQHRNYIGVFIISIISSAVAALWVAIFLNDAESSKEKLDNIDTSKGEHDQVGKPHNPENVPKNTNIILEIINIRNVANTLNTAFKKRDHNGRFFLLFTMVSMAVCLIGYMGENAIGFQFAQRVYHWNAEYYSYMSGTIILIPALVTTITPPILIHKFHLHDTAIGIIGSVSIVVYMFVRGLVLNSAGFFISTVLGSLMGLLPICNRAVVARIIKYNEIGQIYAFLSCIESTGPLISSLFFSELFNATIDDAPGFVYIAAGFVVSFTLVHMVWLYFTRKTWDLVVLGQMSPSDVPTSSNVTQRIASELAVDQKNIDINPAQIERQNVCDINEQSEEIVTREV
ncbi:uncharacterized protein LOC112539573 [Tetranychus urticae]|nr:uncharacterized protein LOC112539573 [Tetranychus urticae]